MRDKPLPSIVMRVVMAKTVGLVFGIAGFIAVPFLLPEVSVLTRIGILLWYPTLGALIGLVGVFDLHPVLMFRMPWWVRGPMVGAWMNFVLVFFAFDTLRLFLDEMTLNYLSPFVFVVEGGLVGAVIGYVATASGGEGPETIGA